jgi:hypothetical protein
MMTRFIAAKKAYVPQPILSNMGPVTITYRSAFAHSSRSETLIYDEEIPQPVTSCTECIGWRSNSKRSYLCGVEPSHAEPSDREPGIEQEEAKYRDDLGGGTIVTD